MNCLLIGGAPAVGKSRLIYQIALELLHHHFIDVTKLIPDANGDFHDFYCILEGLNKEGRKIRMIINTATDTVNIIRGFKSFFDSNGEYDILISSVRDEGNWPRNEFFDILELQPEKHFILEVPMGKITRLGLRKEVALNWHQEKSNLLIKHILSNEPFNVF